MVELVLQITNDINAVDNNDFSALGLALKQDMFKIAFRLLQEENIDCERGAGNLSSCLFLAISKLDIMCVEKMI